MVDEMRRMAANPMIRAMFPTAEQMKEHNIEIGHKEGGTYWALENNKEDWIKAFFGSRENETQSRAGMKVMNSSIQVKR